MSLNEPISGDTTDNCGDKKWNFSGTFTRYNYGWTRDKAHSCLSPRQKCAGFSCVDEKIQRCRLQDLERDESSCTWPALSMPNQICISRSEKRNYQSYLTIYLMDDNVPEEILQHEWRRTQSHPRLVIKDNGTGEKIRTHFWTHMLGTPAAAIEFFWTETSWLIRVVN